MLLAAGPFVRCLVSSIHERTLVMIIMSFHNMESSRWRHGEITVRCALLDVANSGDLVDLY